MNKLIFFVFFIITAALAVQCKPSKTTEQSPESELAAAQKRWPDATVESLKAGQSIYYNECKNCHGANPISNFTEAEWEGIIARMAPKAKLTAEQTELLKRYIYANHDISSKK